MARYNPVYGTSTGRIGPVITYFWRGKQCLRAMPSHYHDRNSIPQQRNRQRFNLMVQTLREILPSIQYGFRNVSQGMSEYNAAFKENYLRALLWEESLGEYALHPELLILSKGILPEVALPFCVIQGNKLHLSWADNSAVNRARKEDRLIVTLYNQSKGKTLLLTPEGATRGSEHITIPTPKSWKNDKVHLYLAFVYVDSENNETYSNSRYITTLNSEEIPQESLLKEESSSGKLPQNSSQASTDQSASKHLSPQVPPRTSYEDGMPRCERNGGEIPLRE